MPLVLQWRLPGTLMRSLLMGKIILDMPGDRHVSDLELVKNWVNLIQQDSEEMRCIVMPRGRSEAAASGDRYCGPRFRTTA